VGQHRTDHHRRQDRGWQTEEVTVPTVKQLEFTGRSHIKPGLLLPLLGIDSDIRSAFINGHLLAWCTSQQVTFTRSWSQNKSGGCRVEQKNWDIAAASAVGATTPPGDLGNWV
jgi:hypothetical protein